MAVTYQQACTATDAPTIRDGILAQLTADGSVVAGLPESSPDRGVIEAEAAQLSLETGLRAGIAQAASITTAVAAGDSWVDVDATWYQVSNGQGGTGRIPAQPAVWTVGLVVAPTAAPLTIQPGQVVQIQATDGTHAVFNFSGMAPVVLNSGSSYKAAPVQFTARLAGAAGSAMPASALQFGAIITGPAGLSIDATVTPTLVTGGRDPETSAALALRCLASWGRLGAGWTDGALNALIPTLAPSVLGWRIDSSNPYGPGTVGVTLADAAGPATDQEVTEVSSGLNAPGVRPLGSGAAVVVKATAHPLTVTIVLAGDGTNANLQAQATAALQALGTALLQAIGPAAISADVLRVVAMGGAYPAGTKIPVITGDGPPFPTIEIPFATPGFGGAAAVESFSTSTGSMEGSGFETLASNEVLVATWSVTVE